MDPLKLQIDQQNVQLFDFVQSIQLHDLNTAKLLNICGSKLDGWVKMNSREYFTSFGETNCVTI